MYDNANVSSKQTGYFRAWETKDILRSFGKFVTNCVMVKKFSQLFHLKINFVLVSGLEFSYSCCSNSAQPTSSDFSLLIFL